MQYNPRFPAVWISPQQIYCLRKVLFSKLCSPRFDKHRSSRLALSPDSEQAAARPTCEVQFKSGGHRTVYYLSFAAKATLSKYWWKNSEKNESAARSEIAQCCHQWHKARGGSIGLRDVGGRSNSRTGSKYTTTRSIFPQVGPVCQSVDCCNMSRNPW